MKFVEAYNMIDLIILGVLFVTFILGLWKGFLRSLTAMTGVIAGIVAAVRYHGVCEPYLSKVSSLDPHIATILSMVILFFLVQVAFVIVRRILEALISFTRLGWLDRALGGAMGCAAGLLLAACGVQALLIAVPEWPTVKQARLVQPMDGLMFRALSYAPKEARDQMDALMAKWKGIQDAQQPFLPRRSAQTQEPPSTPESPVK